MKPPQKPRTWTLCRLESSPRPSCSSSCLAECGTNGRAFHRIRRDATPTCARIEKFDVAGLTSIAPFAEFAVVSSVVRGLIVDGALDRNTTLGLALAWIVALICYLPYEYRA